MRKTREKESKGKKKGKIAQRQPWCVLDFLFKVHTLNVTLTVPVLKKKRKEKSQ